MYCPTEVSWPSETLALHGGSEVDSLRLDSKARSPKLKQLEMLLSIIYQKMFRTQRVQNY